MTQNYKNRKEAAGHVRERGLPCSHTTLAKLATLGGGPAFHKFGRNAVYTTEDLDAWIEGKLSAKRLSTSVEVQQ